MLRNVLLATAMVVALGVSAANAHFIWIELKPAGDAQQARVYFGEEASPGESHLIGKVAHTKLWLRTPSGEPQELKAAAGQGAEEAVLSAGCPSSDAASLEATCDYGIYERGPSGLLLQYYAKHLGGDWARHADKLARTSRLKLDIVPQQEAAELKLQVLYNGQPAPGGEVVVVDPAGEAHEFQADKEGRVVAPTPAGGRYAVRAAHIEPAATGERNGKKFAQTWHYCTLTLDVPGTGKSSKLTASKSSDPSALEALTRARDGRSLWNDFPGFSTTLTVTDGGKQITGKATIDANGTVELDMPKSPVADWVEEQLNSLVQHRMPDGEVAQGQVTYSDEDTSHPLGRKIDLGDPSLQSAYRLKDDVIMEVNRSMGPMRFTISVLEIVRNAENKYLPRSFTMNFFDAKTGELRTGLAYWNDWQRVGKFDLPKTITEVAAKKGGASTRQIAFSDVKLLEQK